MLQGRVAHRAGIVLLVSVGAEKSGLVLWIHLVLLTFSGLLAGGPALGTALARDLNVVFEKGCCRCDTGYGSSPFWSREHLHKWWT